MTTKKDLEEKIAMLEAELEALKSMPEQEIKAQEGKIERVIDIVYPNVAHLAQWDELKYSVRSIVKNLRGVKFQIWIVGDMPTWANGNVKHIPCQFSGKTPRIDILHKHRAVYETEEVDEEYFWMNDDIYFVNAVQYADMCLNVAVNNLEQAARRMDKHTIWGRDNHTTVNLLKQEKLPMWNYAAHIPHRYEKEKVKQLVDQYHMLQQPIILEHLYYNYWFRDFVPYMASLDIGNNLGFSVNRPNPNTANLRMQLKVKKWMNNGEAGMTQLLQSTLLKMFPEKSIFEK